MVFSIIFIYTLVISVFVIPRFDTTIRTLEEKNAKDVLEKVKFFTLNVYDELEIYKKQILQEHKRELRDLTDTAWSIIRSKYEQSKEKNISSVLKNRSKEFEDTLMSFYKKNKDTMSEQKSRPPAEPEACSLEPLKVV